MAKESYSSLISIGMWRGHFTGEDMSPKSCPSDLLPPAEGHFLVVHSSKSSQSDLTSEDCTLTIQLLHNIVTK